MTRAAQFTVDNVCFLLLISFGSVKTERASETVSGRLEEEDLASNTLPIADGGFDGDYGNCCLVLKSEDLESCTLVNATDFQYVNKSAVAFNGEVLLNSRTTFVCASI